MLNPSAAMVRSADASAADARVGDTRAAPTSTVVRPACPRSAGPPAAWQEAALRPAWSERPRGPGWAREWRAPGVCGVEDHPPSCEARAFQAGAAPLCCSSDTARRTAALLSVRVTRWFTGAHCVAYKGPGRYENGQRVSTVSVALLKGGKGGGGMNCVRQLKRNKQNVGGMRCGYVELHAGWILISFAWQRQVARALNRGRMCSQKRKNVHFFLAAAGFCFWYLDSSLSRIALSSLAAAAGRGRVRRRRRLGGRTRVGGRRQRRKLGSAGGLCRRGAFACLARCAGRLGVPPPQALALQHHRTCGILLVDGGGVVLVAARRLRDDACLPHGRGHARHVLQAVALQDTQVPLGREGGCGCGCGGM